MVVRRMVHAMGYRYRLHRKDLPGKPDLVFGPRKKVVFVHGCFWHQHDLAECLDGRRPKSNIGYWSPKLERNVARDAKHIAALESAGWQVMTIWECETKDVATVERRLGDFLGPPGARWPVCARFMHADVLKDCDPAGMYGTGNKRERQGASMSDIIEALEVEEQYLDDTNESPPSDIVAYNELRSCADLFRMYEDGALEVSPIFQRDIVWKGPDQTRFIDSLIKQLPIPSLCFAYDFKQGKWIVIDGLQRISAIVKFLRGDDWKLAILDDIDPGLSGKNAATIKNAKAGELKLFYTRIQNQTLPINVLRCDFSKKSHNEYIFTIFHRLNSGGVKLNNQEIRNCIYTGEFNSLLKELDQDVNWRTINNMQPDENYRFTKQEAILRFFAFMDGRADYKGAVAKFLNDYMFKNRNASVAFIADKASIFTRVVKVINDSIFEGPPPARLPNTVLEALMIGLAENIVKAEALPKADLKARYELLRADDSVSEASLAEGLSKKDKVDARLSAAVAIFSA